MREQSTRDTEAVSITTSYILNIGIATLVISTLVLGMQGTFDNIEQSTADAQAKFVAEKVAGEITQADRLARIDKNVFGTFTFELRGDIAESDYSVEVTDGWVNVTATGTTVRRRYNVSSEVNGGTLTAGGTKQLQYNGSTDPPEVTVVG